MILGLFAHVDAGKTTLSEALLYQSHANASFGRVDHQNAFLDYEEQERKRGITIFAKQASFTWNEREFTLIDTPGHVDFVSQAARTVPVLDAAIMIISATSRVQAHSETLWRLLEKQRVPTFVFVNKTDIADTDRDAIMTDLKLFLDEGCIDFSNENEIQEAIAMQSDDLLEHYMKNSFFDASKITELIQKRKIFPCFFGSALKREGIEALLNGLCTYTEEPQYPDTLSAYVYNISYDLSGTRLTHVKINGGSLSNKQVLFHEKIDQIRCYHGNQYECVNTISAGHICSLCGLKETKIGMSEPLSAEGAEDLMSAALCYRMVLPEGIDSVEMMKKLQWLIDEEPSLRLRYEECSKEINLQLQGSIQKEILIERIKQRLSISVDFTEGSVAYQETIAYPIEGVGHYEMLKHYAEVHLHLIPLQRGSGLRFNSTCPTTMIPTAAQRMILHYLQEEQLCGVTDYPLSDLEIVLISGRVHDKHTAGSDLREAAFRALYQGLHMGKTILLEPTVQFHLTLPAHAFSRALYDLEQMNAVCDAPSQQNDNMRISGTAPLSQIHSYPLELCSYTKGKGDLSMQVIGYQIVEEKRASKLIDANSAKKEMKGSSLFLIQGSPTYIRYDQVYRYADVKLQKNDEEEIVRSHVVHRQIKIDENELRQAVAKLHQPRKQYHERIGSQTEKSEVTIAAKPHKQPCLIVDGYNMIFAWSNLKEIAQDNIDAARKSLISMLASYHGYQRGELIIVFDAYQREAFRERIYKDHTVYVVYTKHAQTADAYIEKTTHQLSDTYQITVATSDKEEQNVILAQGAMRMSANELYQKLQLQYRHEQQRRQSEPQYRNHALADLRKLNEADDSFKSK